MAPREYTLRRRAETSAATRRRILDATEGVLREHGVTGMTFTAVAKAADVARGTILHHFGSSDGLLGAVLDDLLVQLEVPDERIVDGIDDRDTRIRIFVDAMIDFQERSQAWWSVFEREMDRPEVQARTASYWESFGRLQAAALGPELAENPAAGAAVVALSHPATAGTFLWSFERAGATAAEARQLISDLAIDAVRRVAGKGREKA